MDIYREPVSKIVSASGGLIVDSGQLQKAVQNSESNYLFSEVDMGVTPLVIISHFYATN